MRNYNGLELPPHQRGPKETDRKEFNAGCKAKKWKEELESSHHIVIYAMSETNGLSPLTDGSDLIDHGTIPRRF